MIAMFACIQTFDGVSFEILQISSLLSNTPSALPFLCRSNQHICQYLAGTFSRQTSLSSLAKCLANWILPLPLPHISIAHQTLSARDRPTLRLRTLLCLGVPVGCLYAVNQCLYTFVEEVADFATLSTNGTSSSSFAIFFLAPPNVHSLLRIK